MTDLKLLLKDNFELTKEYILSSEERIIEYITVQLEEDSSLASHISDYTFTLIIKLPSQIKAAYTLNPDTETTFEKLSVPTSFSKFGDKTVVYIEVRNDGTLIDKSTELIYAPQFCDYRVPTLPLSISNKDTLSAAGTFDTGDYCVTGACYQFDISGALAAEVGIEVESGVSKPCEMRFVNSYQIITQTDTQQVFSRKVTSVAPYFNSDNWAEVINPAITSLQTTVGTLNTQLENALNGGA